LSSDNSVAIQGPEDSLGAFSIITSPTAPTDTSNWEILATDFTDSFSLYAVLNTTDYNGPILVIGNDLDIGLITSIRYCYSCTRIFIMNCNFF